MSDINLIVLCGRLTTDAQFKDRGEFLAVRLLLATNRIARQKDAPDRKIVMYHTIDTKLEQQTHLVELWKQRCVKGARISLQGMLAMDTYEKDGKTHHFVHVVASSAAIILPDAANVRPHADTAKPDAAREIPAKLANRRNALNF